MFCACLWGVYAWRLWFWFGGRFGWLGRRSRCAWVAFGVLTSVCPPPLLVLALRFSLGRRPCLSCLFRSASRRCVVCVLLRLLVLGSRSLVSLWSCRLYAARPGWDVGMGHALCVVCDACVCARLARFVRLRTGSAGVRLYVWLRLPVRSGCAACVLLVCLCRWCLCCSWPFFGWFVCRLRCGVGVAFGAF